MPDLIKSVPIALDRPRHLKFDLNAMVEFERASGKGFTQLGKATSAADIRALLWAGLIHEDKALTLEEVGAMVSLENLAEISQKLVEAITAAMPVEKAEPGAVPQT